tara:strand:- start:1542 stop:3260 length:1719 start_codon:yes stop_codon:yes gene_type:complete
MQLSFKLKNYFLKKFKYIYFLVILLVYKSVLKVFFKDRKRYPINEPFLNFQLFNNINENKIFPQKLILPYENIKFIDRQRRDISYESLEACIIGPRKQIKIPIKETNSLILPIAVLDKSIFPLNKRTNLKILFGKKNYSLDIFDVNKFHYLPLKQNNLFNEVIVKSSSSNLAISKPINNFINSRKENNKLIVHILVDALAQHLIDIYGWDIMPNTYNFFKDNGAFFENAYSQSEWTLPSITSLFTGEYTNKHLIFHPRDQKKIKLPTLADELSKNGFYTFSCSAIRLVNPFNGFDKGFDRFINANGKDDNFIINQAIEQIDSYSGSQYLFLGLFDFHDYNDSVIGISNQYKSNLIDFDYSMHTNSLVDMPYKNNNKNKSKSSLFNQARVNRAKNALIQLDKKLNRLFKFIEDHDMKSIVIVNADHGVHSLKKINNERLLSSNRQKVVFLYKDNNLTKGTDDPKEIIELPSMLFNTLGLDNPFKYEKKDYALSESIYPNRHYEISIRTKKHVFFYFLSWDKLLKNNLQPCFSSISLLNDESNILNNKLPEFKRLSLIALKHASLTFKSLKNQF